MSVEQIRKPEVIDLRPAIKLDLNKAIADTRFMQDLSTILYGAELALKRVNATDAQISDIQNEIVQNTFSSLEFDFGSAGGAAGKAVQPAQAAPPPAPPAPAAPLANYAANQPAAADTSPRYTSAPGTYSVPDYDVNYDFFDENPNDAADLNQMYKTAEKTYDSHMDDDEDFEKSVAFPSFQFKL